MNADCACRSEIALKAEIAAIQHGAHCWQTDLWWCLKVHVSRPTNPTLSTETYYLLVPYAEAKPMAGLENFSTISI